MYNVHLAMQTHPLAEDLGGLGGYKIGAVGAEGEPCLYAPLFADFLVDARERSTFASFGARSRSGERPLSARAIGLHQIEPEFAVLLGDDVAPRADGQPHAANEVWRRVEHVALSIECCGQRATPDVIAATSRLGKFQDALSAGGVLLGKRLHARSFDGHSLASCETTLSVNGEVVASGSGAACPEGGPVGALGWLANHLNSRGLRLRSGMVVATGQTCIYRGAVAGDTVVASFGTLGRVEMVVDP
jgi:2-keto-4-pentenoate hydratase